MAEALNALADSCVTTTVGANAKWGCYVVCIIRAMFELVESFGFSYIIAGCPQGFFEAAWSKSDLRNSETFSFSVPYVCNVLRTLDRFHKSSLKNDLFQNRATVEHVENILEGSTVARFRKKTIFQGAFVKQK